MIESVERLFTISRWDDYELIDTGGFEKLERFGKYILTRPEPKAVWKKDLSPEEWEKQSHAVFRNSSKGTATSNDATERGEWKVKSGMPDRWIIGFQNKGVKINLRLGMTSFKHVGVFPEQANNWQYIIDQTKRLQKQEREEIQILNLFAYTGAASLVARASGAVVTHVDSIKQVITWANENMEHSGLENIKWVVEDALKFVKREVKRGKMYHGVMLDPPAYGRGPDGERWILDDQIDELMEYCGKLLAPSSSFLILNLYSLGVSSLAGENLMKLNVGKFEKMEAGDVYLEDKFGKKLPLGVLVRGAR